MTLHYEDAVKGTSWEEDFYSAQTKVDFINEHADCIPIWVVQNHLDEFCKHMGFDKWRDGTNNRERIAKAKLTFLQNDTRMCGDWVLFNKLDEFCKFGGYAQWKKMKQANLEKMRHDKAVETIAEMLGDE